MYNSNYAGGAVPTKVLDARWQPSTPVEQEYEGYAWQRALVRHEDAIPPVYEEECFEGECEKWIVEEEIPAADWVEVLGNEGAGISFDLAGGAYVAPDYAREYTLTKEGNTLVLADSNGTRTVFTENEVGTQGEYRATSVSWQASPKEARMVYEQSSGAYYRLKLMIAPPPPSVTCSESGNPPAALSTPGCRTLSFQYSNGPKHYNEDRLTSITYHNATGENPQVVAQYAYSANGRLTEVWDPRVSPALKEKYTYGPSENEFVLTKLTPPGEEPWEFDYHAYQYDYRLKSVKRASLLESPSVAQTTIAYDVPIAGEDAPYDMSPETVAEWGQADYPVNATAIFPPDQIPDDPPDDYSQATIYYMDSEGYLANTASPSPPGIEGDTIATSETDDRGNVIRELSPQSRLDALAAEDPAQRAEELSTKRVFNSDGTEMQEEWGPLHEIKLESGETVEARAHKRVFYDEGAPELKEGEAAPHLPTKELVGARVSGQESDVDVRRTDTKYDWDLRLPTDTIVDPEGLKLQTHIEYDKETGLPLERRLPANPNGGDASSTKILYYTTDSHPTDSACGDKAAWANLPCKVLPAKQPGTAGQPDLLVTKYASYNSLDQPTELIESPGGTSDTTKIRKAITTYDGVGRPLTVKREGGGVAIPTTEVLYDPETGRPTTQRFVCESECTAGIKYSSSFGASGTGNGQLAHPAGSAVDVEDNIWVVDQGNNRVQKFDSEGKYVTQFGTKGSGNGQLSGPMDVAIDEQGNLWVADRGNHRVQKFNPKGEYLSKFGSQGSGSGQFSSYGPRGIAIDAQGDLWVSDYSGRVQEFNSKGEFVKAVGSYGSGEGQFGESAGLDVAEGKVWVGDWTKHRVSVFSDAGKFLFQFGSSGTGNGQFSHPDGVEVDSQGNVWVLDEGNNRVQKFDSEGKYVTQFGTKGSGAGQFSFSWPVGIAADSSDNIWVSDTNNNRVQKWVPSASFDDQALTTTYDTLGRPTSYEDADGNLSSTGYDLLGRPTITSDGKGYQAMTYDPASGLLVELEDSAAGTFTASYDANGNLVAQGLPNGLTAKTTYDEAGAPVHLRYEKTFNCVSECTWLDEDIEESIHGQWLSRTGILSSQQYTYDKAGRLTLVKDTSQGGTCTTRAYSYDANSNRTKLTTREPGIGGACDTSSEGKVQSYSYDAADRLLGSEIEYDNFGRITTLPKAYSGGGVLTTSYYVNDLTHSQSQGGITNTYGLDAGLRERERVTTGGSEEGTEIYHYAGGSDSPAWTEEIKGEETSWTRNISALSDGLGAIETDAGEVTLQLVDMHGDVVATAEDNPEAAKLLSTQRFDEFGNPMQSGFLEGGDAEYGWLGGKKRRTQLPSGVIQMGRRSYVPAIGRFISTDPIAGGSANAYDYANADPVNGFDLAGTDATSSHDLFCRGRVHAHTHHGRYERGGYGRVKVRFNVYCARRGESMHAVSIRTRFSGPRGTISEHHMGIPELAHNSHINHSGEVEIGNYKKSNPLSYQCLQGATYEWTIEVEMWVTAKDCALCEGFVHTFQLHATSICRG